MVTLAGTDLRCLSSATEAQRHKGNHELYKLTRRAFGHRGHRGHRDFRRGFTQMDTVFSGPEGGNGVGDFVLEDFDDFLFSV
jgi:hypothetical protein